MASSSVNADTLISVKVGFDGGATRRFRLPLRDLTVNVFENRLRALLQVPADVAILIERYSDSATSYVTLESSNMAVYKQLYRAAKAKQKLRLRVTTVSREPVNEIQAPKSVTIEDEPEEQSQTISQHDVQQVAAPIPEVELEQAPEVELEQEPEQEAEQEFKQEHEPEPKQEVQEEAAESSLNSTSASIDTIVAPRTCEEFPAFVKDWRARGRPRIHVRRDDKNTEMIDFLGPNTAAEPSITFEHPSSTTQGGSLIALASAMREASGGLLATANTFKNEVDEVKSLWARQLANIRSGNLPDRKSPDPIPIEKIWANAVRKESPKPAIPVTEKNEEVRKTEAVAQPEPPKSSFTVCCNSCDNPVPDTHFHCSICDEGDFDLCQACVDRGIACYGDGHWLIKRTIVDGRIECSSTHIIPKSIRSSAVKTTSPPAISSMLNLPARPLVASTPSERSADYNARTCNSCVREFQDEEFVHCTTCEDYDLCKTCFTKDQHGHHPKHGFTPVVKGSVLDYKVSSRLPPGRNVLHNAICDGCDKYIRGIRHKCLDCPDWDYCADCVKNASLIHSGHRFVVIYDALTDRPIHVSSRVVHYGITCDGPLCSTFNANPGKYIVGDRYKCAVCHDTDFCASCEASPSNAHNKTHPLIKFKTPVRHVSVTTTGEHEDGKRLPTMGDRCQSTRSATQSPEKPASPRENIAATPVQTVVNVQPTEQSPAPVASSSDTVEVKKEVDETKLAALPEVCNLVAIFKWDTIKDGSVLPPNHTFEQTWVLRNEGTVPWPAGCSVKFVGGDYMGAVDPARPAGIRELISASESTICYNALNPGQEFPFTVLMRTPDRDGKIISYWRLTTPDGVKFGHKLWCDVTVQSQSKIEQVETEAPADDAETETEVKETSSTSLTESRMIIPTLEHESQVSVRENRSEVEAETETDTLAPSTDDDDGFEDCGGHDEWADESGDSFLTDDEYDILDASDEEFLFEQQKTLPKK